ncbi:hypothetical protein [Rhodococcus sp. NPDC058521]|uniref:hypothetical protein n=1 Tax=Rhodococcus sp. NPDC058521 TaxID=3346536 RepID=UPI00364F06C5
MPGPSSAITSPDIAAAPPAAPLADNAPAAASAPDNPEALPVVHTEPLPVAATLGGIGVLFVCAAGAGAATFRGARAQQARLAAARAEFLVPMSAGGA